MGFYPFNPSLEFKMQTDVPGVTAEGLQIAALEFDDIAAVDEDATGLGAVASSNTVVTVVDVSAIEQPDMPRCVQINPNGTVADVAAKSITITGTNILDEPITEDIALAENQAHDTISVGSKAFKTITGISIPTQDGAAATFLFGYSKKIGLPYKRAHYPVIWATAAGTKEATLPTLAASATAIESNTISFNTAPDGSKDFVAYVIV